jgi:hypothetical protein
MGEKGGFMTIQERIWDMVADLVQDRYQNRLWECKKKALYNLWAKDIADQIDDMAFRIERDIIDEIDALNTQCEDMAVDKLRSKKWDN